MQGEGIQINAVYQSSRCGKCALNLQCKGQIPNRVRLLKTRRFEYKFKEEIIGALVVVHRKTSLVSCLSALVIGHAKSMILFSYSPCACSASNDTTRYHHRFDSSRTLKDHSTERTRNDAVGSIV